jgi:hypothetical protein
VTPRDEPTVHGGQSSKYHCSCASRKVLSSLPDRSLREQHDGKVERCFTASRASLEPVTINSTHKYFRERQQFEPASSITRLAHLRMVKRTFSIVLSPSMSTAKRTILPRDGDLSPGWSSILYHHGVCARDERNGLGICRHSGRLCWKLEARLKADTTTLTKLVC